MAKQTGVRRGLSFPECLETCPLYYWADPVACFDNSSRILFANKQFTAWFGDLEGIEPVLSIIEGRIATRLLQLIRKRSRKHVSFSGAGSSIHGTSTRFDLDFMPLAENGDYFFMLHFYDSSRNLSLFRQSLEIEKYQSLATLAAGITHNFNNILAGIKGYAGLIRKWAVESGSTAGVYAEGIERLAERGADVTHKLLSFAGRERHFTAPMEVNALLQEAVAKAAVPAMDRGVTLECRPLGRKLYLMGDRFQLLDALGNVILNAIEAFDAPGGRVVVQAVYRRQRIASPDPIQAEGLSPTVQISVSDTGRGMPREDIPHAFEPFFTSKQTNEGLGLGLPIALGIVQNHGGDIRLESRKGKGTRIRIVLPVYDLPPVELPASRAESQAVEPGSPAASVLVVDDEPDIRKIMSKLLSELGLRVITAESGEQSLEQLARAGPDLRLVILDMVLDDMSGIEVLQQIRQLRPALPVLFVSGQDFQYRNRELLSQGAAGFLGKPFNLGDLQMKVLQLIQRDGGS